MRIRVPSSPSPLSLAHSAAAGTSAPAPAGSAAPPQAAPAVPAADRMAGPEILPPSPISRGPVERTGLSDPHGSSGGSYGSRAGVWQPPAPGAGGADSFLLQPPQVLGKGRRFWSSGSLGSCGSSSLAYSRGSWDEDPGGDAELEGATPRLASLAASAATADASVGPSLRMGTSRAHVAPLEARQQAEGQQQQQQQQQAAVPATGSGAALSPVRALHSTAKAGPGLQGPSLRSMQSIYGSSSGGLSSGGTSSSDDVGCRPPCSTHSSAPLGAHARWPSQGSSSAASAGGSSSGLSSVMGNRLQPVAGEGMQPPWGHGRLQQLAHDGRREAVALGQQLGLAAADGCAVLESGPPGGHASAAQLLSSGGQPGGARGGQQLASVHAEQGPVAALEVREEVGGSGRLGRGSSVGGGVPNGDSAYATLGATPSRGLRGGGGVADGMGGQLVKEVGGGGGAGGGWAGDGKAGGSEGGGGAGGGQESKRWGRGNGKGRRGWGWWRRVKGRTGRAGASTEEEGEGDVEAPGAVALPRAAAMVRSRIEVRVCGVCWQCVVA